jgi:hypothetical protein
MTKSSKAAIWGIVWFVLSVVWLVAFLACALAENVDYGLLAMSVASGAMMGVNRLDMHRHQLAEAFDDEE